MRKQAGLVGLVGAAAMSMTMVLGGGFAAADDDPFAGRTYGDAAERVSGWGATPVVASATGSQLGDGDLDDCVVISSKRSHYADGMPRDNRRQWLFYLNCNAALANGKPGNSVTSPAGQKMKKDQDLAQRLQKVLDKNPEYCEGKTWCVPLCERTGMCEVPS